ncbi:MAG TPA: signal peptidase II [Acidimicrobiales bacterium]|nr:signal peptidase II [Acidimicrobiales bacterium]
MQERGPVPTLSEAPTATAERDPRRRILVVVIAAVLVLAADQITKQLAVDKLSNHDVHIVGPFSFALTYNSGIAFSLGRGLTVPIVVLVVAVVGALLWFVRSVPSLPAALAFGLIIGGACGNLSDRFFRGHHGQVVDFIASTFWPTFNVADACVVCGCALLAVTLVFGHEPGRGEEKA